MAITGQAGHLTMKTIGSRAILMILVSLATLMMTSVGSAQGFGMYVIVFRAAHYWLEQLF